MEIYISNHLRDFTYYRNLSSGEKEKFETRVDKFIKAKEFEGKSNFEVTDKVKVLVAATAIQLTFGLEKFTFRHFHKILIYPEKFYSPFSKSTNVGEVNLGGIIVLSWKAFEDGFKDEKDSYNVALHEMAHALNFTDLMDKDIDPDFSEYYAKWYVHARKILENPEDKARKFLREYAGKNIQELFAVGVENFFERSEEFKKEVPELYEQYCYLLNQDPLNKDCQLIFPEDQPMGQDKLLYPGNSSGTFRMLASLLPIGIVAFQLIYHGLNIIPLEYVIGGSITLASIIVWYQWKRNACIDVYQNKVVISYPFQFLFDKKKEFNNKNMIYVEFIDDEKSNDLFFVWYEKGIIRKESISVNSGFESFFSLFKFLYDEKNVGIKRNGEIFIPTKAAPNSGKSTWKKMVGVR